jgi:murein DD-endopeptidase MepM/ murein hydrolase activator NlpD
MRPFELLLRWLPSLLIFLVVNGLHAQDSFSNEADTVAAVVQYGEEKLVDGAQVLTDEVIEQMLDSLCSLDPIPADLVRDLKLFQRIRRMDQSEMVLLIDSLFDLETVPYALINEINLYASEMPSQDAVDEASYVAWGSVGAFPCEELYGPWNTTNPNAYGPELSRQDSVLLVKLIDAGSNCGFSLPVPGICTSRFGWREGRAHNGIDLDLYTGETVVAMFPGVVRFAGPYGSFGRLVVIRHYNGLETFYAHLHRTKVKIGDQVDAGETIGLGGNTGRSFGSHLHLEVRFKGIPIDPSRFIDLSLGRLTCDVLVLKKTRWSYAAYPLGTRFHTVRKGEHLYTIAEQYGTSIESLCELNGISKRSILRAGQQLMVSADL